MWHGACRVFAGSAISGGVSARRASSKSDAADRLLKLVSSMPRERTHVPAAQQQRAHISERGDKFGPSSVYLQVLGAGYPNSLYLFTDQKRYLFNCGEGTQRLAHEHKVKLSRLEHVLVTSKTWRHIGGLPGVALTLQDVGVPKITLHGPPGLDELFNATRRFVIMKDMEVSMAPCSPAKDFHDSVMSVKYVLIGPEDNVLEQVPAKRQRFHHESRQPNEFEDDNIDYYNHENVQKPEKVIEKTPVKQKSPERDVEKKVKENPAFTLGKKSNCSVSYICTLKKRMGSLDLSKCVERGVKPGPLLGLLKQGKDVLLPDGRLVYSADVKTPDQLGPVFIVLDVPNLKYLKESEFREHFDDGFNPPENIPAVIAHFTPRHILEDQKYKDFVRRFGAKTRHLLLNSEDCSGSVAVHRMQHKLHLLDPDIFPLLRDATIPEQWTQAKPSEQSEQLKNSIALAQFESIFKNNSPKVTVQREHAPCKETEEENNTCISEEVATKQLEFHETYALTTYHLRPKKMLDRTSELKLNIQQYISETMDVDGFQSSLEQFRQLADKLRAARPTPAREFPRVVFLGTGSCIPNKTRNTSAILLHLDESHCMLMDCGEGTYAQLVRLYGHQHVRNVLASLRAVYVSHLHADHHIGLIGVLQGRRRALNELQRESESDEELINTPLYLLAPGQIMTWLAIYDQHFEKIRTEFQMIPNQTLLPNPHPYSGETMTPAVLASIGLRSVKTCQVQHCPNSFGVTVEVASGEKITYSGDTMPCEELVELGEGSTLLIHEATMEDELASEAKVKKHSTTSQAIEMGRLMHAQHTLLTHFSQRYARMPRLAADFIAKTDSVSIAFDNMQVTMDDLELLPHMYKALQLMFTEHCQEMEQKAIKRANKRELHSRSSTPGGDRASKKHQKSSDEGSILSKGYHQRPSSVSPKRYSSPGSDSARSKSRLSTGRASTPGQLSRKVSKESLESGGYGKPLLTPMNKKITIQRCTTHPASSSNKESRGPSKFNIPNTRGQERPRFSSNVAHAHSLSASPVKRVGKIDPTAAKRMVSDTTNNIGRGRTRDVAHKTKSPPEKSTARPPPRIYSPLKTQVTACTAECTNKLFKSAKYREAARAYKQSVSGNDSTSKASSDNVTGKPAALITSSCTEAKKNRSESCRLSERNTSRDPTPQRATLQTPSALPARGYSRNISSLSVNQPLSSMDNCRLSEKNASRDPTPQRGISLNLKGATQYGATDHVGSTANKDKVLYKSTKYREAVRRNKSPVKTGLNQHSINFGRVTDYNSELDHNQK